jgi:hypothetical protein
LTQNGKAWIVVHTISADPGPVALAVGALQQMSR